MDIKDYFEAVLMAFEKNHTEICQEVCRQNENILGRIFSREQEYYDKSHRFFSEKEIGGVWMGVKPKYTVTSLDNNYMKQQEFSERTSARRRKLLIRRLSVFLVLAIAVCTILISTLVSSESALKSKQAEKAQMEEKLAKLEKRQSMLENEIVKLNDDEYIAKLARTEYFLSDKGEIIFNIPKPKEKE